MRYTTIAAAVLALGSAVPASRAAAQAQAAPVSTESVSFDRPEAWAMKFFTAATTFTGIGLPEVRRPGSFDFGVEAGLVPHLSASQRTVGFNGTALEDMNKTPVIARPRLAVGLPGGITAELGWVPPVTLNGAKANLLSAALERPVVESGAFVLGLRLYGQIGHAKGDVTCWDESVAQPHGSPGNPLGCDARSRDVTTLNNAGAALTGGFRFAGRGSVHLSAGATYQDTQFQVGAYLNGVPDNSVLKVRGWTGWAAAGANWRIGPAELGAEAFYSPLTVRRPGSATTNDDFFSVRGVLRYRFR